MNAQFKESGQKPNQFQDDIWLLIWPTLLLLVTPGLELSECLLEPVLIPSGGNDRAQTCG